jgi:hypothetical protein
MHACASVAWRHISSLFWIDNYTVWDFLFMIEHKIERKCGVSVAEWLRSLTSNYLPFTAVGLNPDRDIGFFHSLWNISDSTQVPVPDCPFVTEIIQGRHRGLPLPVKMERCHMTYTVSVWRKSKPNQTKEFLINFFIKRQNIRHILIFFCSYAFMNNIFKTLGLTIINYNKPVTSNKIIGLECTCSEWTGESEITSHFCHFHSVCNKSTSYFCKTG